MTTSPTILVVYRAHIVMDIHTTSAYTVHRHKKNCSKFECTVRIYTTTYQQHLPISDTVFNRECIGVWVSISNMTVKTSEISFNYSIYKVFKLWHFVNCNMLLLGQPHVLLQNEKQKYKNYHQQPSSATKLTFMRTSQVTVFREIKSMEMCMNTTMIRWKWMCGAHHHLHCVIIYILGKPCDDTTSASINLYSYI